MNGPLDPPNAPFIHSASGSSQDSLRADSTSNLSLTVNYLPAKFATSLLSPGARRRKGKGLDVPKRGGGVDAFRTGANRIPGKHDEDDDASGWFSKGKKNMKWTRFKWILFAANILLTIYSITALIFCLLTWFNVWTHADVVRVGNRPELIVSTLASVVGIITSLFGWAGLLLNNRAFLAVYTLFTWITFAMLVIPGYITYRRLTFNLEGKINAEWSRDLGTEGRLRIQNQLGCCGYFSPFVEATISSTCYARSILPGCKLRYLQFERLVLGRWFKVAFAIVPAQLFVMISALLCSNHVTYRFGKGMMPKAYRLSMGSMAVIMDNYANQLAEQYGSDVANDIVNKSRSNLHLDKLGSPSPMVSMPYANNHGTPGYQHTKYDSVGGGGRPAPEGAS
ncbi:hypothetical protein C8J56DRAFT_799725 [Mycena floridula]|nr:hypothetical protein C8J56DRAFT_799725 [Mycena floridula]